MIETIKDDLIAHAAEEYPNECCGLVVVFKGRVKYVRCRNIADNKQKNFEIHPEDYLACEELGEISAVFHSHTNARSTPSEADKASCEVTGLPWIILGYPSGDFTKFEPSGYVAPLIGRQFVHGVHDCYGLARDYYASIGILIPDFERPDRWWEKGFDLLNPDNFRKAGFVDISLKDLKEHDAIITQNGSNVPNHCMIYVGSNQILHHSENRLSSRDVYGGYYLKNSRYFLRHESLLDS